MGDKKIFEYKNNKSLGDIGEKFAKDFLINNDYKIIRQNFRVGKFGEIDIIAHNEEYICFIEVKSRTNLLYGTPSESVTPAKQRKIRKISQVYISKFNLHHENIRFDIVEIMLEYQDGQYNLKSINLIKNAF